MSPKQRKGLYSRVEIHEDRKGLGYLYQAVITIAPSNAPPEPKKETNDDGHTAEDSEVFKPAQAPHAFEEGAQAMLDEL